MFSIENCNFIWNCICSRSKSHLMVDSYITVSVNVFITVYTIQFLEIKYFNLTYILNYIETIKLLNNIILYSYFDTIIWFK